MTPTQTFFVQGALIGLVIFVLGNGIIVFVQFGELIKLYASLALLAVGLLIGVFTPAMVFRKTSLGKDTKWRLNGIGWVLSFLQIAATIYFANQAVTNQSQMP